MEVIDYILQHSKKPTGWKDLKKSLESNFDKMKSAQQHYNLKVLQEVLNPQQHAMGLCYLLAAKAAAQHPDKMFVIGLEGFVFSFEQGVNQEQLRMGSSMFCSALHKYTEMMRKTQHYNRAMGVLSTALKYLRISSEYLTPIHADYLSLCLKSKNYQAGHNLIKDDIIYVDPKITGMTPRDMLLYYYYGGMIFIGMNKFVEAERFFEIGLSVPAHALNAIMVEIFKKYIFICLLNHGKMKADHSESKHLATQKGLETYCSSYINFAKAFSKSNIEELHKTEKKHHKEFEKDNNLGLVNQCISAWNRRNIQKLTSTYLTLSLTDLAKHADLDSPQEAEKMLLRMMDNGEINARINQKDGVIVFKEQKEKQDDPRKQLAQIISLGKKLREMDTGIINSEPYLCKLMGVRPEDIHSDSKQRKGIRAFTNFLG